MQGARRGGETAQADPDCAARLRNLTVRSKILSLSFVYGHMVLLLIHV